MALLVPISMDDLLPPPPYTPRDDLTPSSSTKVSPTSCNLHLDQLEHGSNGRPSHDYSAYEQVLAETDPNPTEHDEPLPAYQPGSHRSNVDRKLDLPDIPNHSAVLIAPCGRPMPSGVSRLSAPSSAWTARAPFRPATFTREPLQSAPFGLSAFQRVIDLTRQLSERSADQVARSMRAGLKSRCEHHCHPAPVRPASSCSSSSLKDPLSGHDYRALDNLDLTTLRTSIANLMRDPSNQDEILQAVSRLRDDIQNRRDRTFPKHQMRNIKAEILANRKKVRAMRQEAKVAKKAEDRERKCETRAEQRARKRCLCTAGGDSVPFSPA